MFILIAFETFHADDPWYAQIVGSCLTFLTRIHYIEMIDIAGKTSLAIQLHSMNMEAPVLPK